MLLHIKVIVVTRGFVPAITVTAIVVVTGTCVIVFFLPLSLCHVIIATVIVVIVNCVIFLTSIIGVTVIGVTVIGVTVIGVTVIVTTVIGVTTATVFLF